MQLWKHTTPILKKIVLNCLSHQTFNWGHYRIYPTSRCTTRCQLHSWLTTCTTQRRISWLAEWGGRHTLLCPGAYWRKKRTYLCRTWRQERPWAVQGSEELLGQTQLCSTSPLLPDLMGRDAAISLKQLSKANWKVERSHERAAVNLVRLTSWGPGEGWQPRLRSVLTLPTFGVVLPTKGAPTCHNQSPEKSLFQTRLDISTRTLLGSCKKGDQNESPGMDVLLA